MNTLHTSRILRGLAVVALSAAAPWALAHGGSLAEHSRAGLADGLLNGLLHPLAGLDHLLALLAVGAWSAVAIRPRWFAPAAFLAMLALGVLVGFAGVQAPGVEPMLAASLLVLGLLLARSQALPSHAAGALVGAFALFHGLAHGAELGAGLGAGLGLGGQWAAFAGLTASSAVLLALGSLIGRYGLVSRVWLQRAGGGAVALLGGGLLLGLMR